MIVSYNGSFFYGWQKTPDGPTVQSTIEEAISQCHGGGTYTIYGASRTDKGVHAYGQCFTLNTERNWQREQLRKAINFYLKSWEISILSCENTTEDFSARHNALGKIYRYQVYLSNSITPLLQPYFLLWYLPVDLEKLDYACKSLLNSNNLNGFAHGYQELKRPYTLEKLDYEIIGKELIFTFQARGFFHHEIRFLVSHILRYASNILQQEEFFIPINNPGKNQFIKHIAPAKALFLLEIFYSK